MKSLDTIQKLSKLGRVLSNLAFIFSIVGCVGCLLGMIALQSGAGSIVAGIAAGLMQAEPASGMAQNFDSSGSIVLGIMFLLGSLLCRYGAELRGNTEPDEI